MRSITFLVLAFFSLSTLASAQEHSTGLLFLDDGAYRSIPLASTPLMGEVPTQRDLSANFPTPGNQGHQASCVAWAVSYALKSYQENVERQWNVHQRSHLFSPAFIYNQIKQSPDCNGGSLIENALNLIRRDGAATLQDFPYNENQCSSAPNAAVKQQARPYAIADWRRVNVQDEMEVKTQIAAGFPVVIGMVVDNAFSQLQRGEVYRSPDHLDQGGHAMVVVGYSDSKGAFKIINSWGTNWADQGFGWIDYQTFKILVREGYVVQDIVATPPPPQPEPKPEPTPEPKPINVAMVAPTFFHNVPVPVNTPYGSAPGMQITLHGQITGAAAHSIQAEVHFGFLNGSPLRANPLESIYRDVSGLVAVGTQSTTVGSDEEDLSSIVLMIPYYALNFPPTNGINTYNLALIAQIYVDGKILSQSQAVPFGLRW